MGVEIRLHHLSGMSLVNTVFGVANLLIHGEVIDALEKLWKLGMVYNNPEIPNEDISRNLIDHEFLWGYVSANIGDTNTF